MKDLVIGDLHFGIKSNSISWLQLQIDFFTKQIFPLIETEKPDRLIFLGDVFDIRYAINQQVGIEVKKLFRQLDKKYNGPIYFVAGNHDFYSQLEEFVEYNAYDLVFGTEFLQCHKNFHFIINEPFCDTDGTLFLPWYWTENPEHFDDMLYRYKMGTEVKQIYCHTDLTVWPGARITSLRGIPVYSGHIHYPYTDALGNLYNLGAALALTFNDVNDDRHIYIINDYKITGKIKNVTTPKFRRYLNEAIFKLTDEDFVNAYIEFYISSSQIDSARYKEYIDSIKKKHLGTDIHVYPIDDEEVEKLDTSEGFNTNITTYIADRMPEHLKDKFEYIKSKINKV